MMCDRRECVSKLFSHSKTSENLPQATSKWYTSRVERGTQGVLLVWAQKVKINRLKGNHRIKLEWMEAMFVKKCVKCPLRASCVSEALQSFLCLRVSCDCVASSRRQLGFSLTDWWIKRSYYKGAKCTLKAQIMRSLCCKSRITIIDDARCSSGLCKICGLNGLWEHRRENLPNNDTNLLTFNWTL